MNHFGRIAIVVASSLLFFSSAQAISTFGTYAQGSDLDPISGFRQDGGEGSSSAAVSFTTFRAEADFDPLSTYLPLLKAESDGSGALFDDDRTQAYAEAYQVFTSASNQTIQLDIRLDSVVTNSAGGTSSVLSDIYVIGGSDFRLDDFFCSSGQRGDMEQRTELFQPVQWRQFAPAAGHADFHCRRRRNLRHTRHALRRLFPGHCRRFQHAVARIRG